MRYFGGKAQDGVYHTIINQIPPHTRYIEPFLGGGAIMRRKKPAEMINIGIDLDRSAIDYFLSAADITIPNLHLMNSDALAFLKYTGRIFGPETFIYCDPPYRMVTRSDSRTRYRFEMDDADHQELLGIIKELYCSVMISTYPNDMYSEELKDWRVVEFRSVKSNGVIAIEHLFMNYPAPKFLHDYRYIGNDSGNRQDINRRIQRTVKRILRWTKHERVKMLQKFISEIPEDERKILLAGAGKNAGSAELTHLVEQVISAAPDPEKVKEQAK